jgi:dipeptidyl aminopeptidase/acylaminoacyl peptidase
VNRSIAFAVILISCTTAAPMPVQAPPPPAPDPVVIPSGTPAPWPAVATAPVTGLRTQTRPLPLDITSLRGLRGAAISRDGSRVAYVVRVPSFDPKAKPAPDDTKGGWKVEQQLYVIDRAGGSPVQLTFGDDPVNAPRFSPDGRSIAFIRKHGAKPALQVIAVAGGEPRIVAVGDYEIRRYDWTPDGKSFAFTAVRPPGDDDKAAQWKRGGAHTYDREWQQTHLFVVPLAGGEPRHVNRGSETVVDYAWSPDGRRIALVLAAGADPVVAGAFQRLVVVNAADGETVQDIDKGDGQTPFIVGRVAWSPDGRQLAYTLTARGGLSEFDELRVRAIGASGASARHVDIAAGLDLELGGFAWAGDARSVIALATARTTTKLVRLPVDGHGAREIPIGKHVLGGMDADRTGRYLSAGASTSDRPASPVVIDTERGTVTTLVELNPEVAQWTIGRTEIVSWKTKEGATLEGILTVTRDPTAGSPPPLVVIPHGGPDASSVESFDAWAQLFAARGYSVFEPNYRGSTGYGRAFFEANRGRFGEIEQMDIESGVDALIASGKADAHRLFFAGWSWGGYISTWMLGHTDRYRAFMIGAGVVDTIVQYATSDINHAAAADWEYKGRPWSTDTFERSNPARSLGHAKSPVLIFHGENDTRVPFVNSQILYRALVDKGVPVTFWSFPREPHGPQEPAHLEHLFEVWTSFFDAELAKPTG